MSIIKPVTLQKIVAHDFQYDPRMFERKAVISTMLLNCLMILRDSGDEHRHHVETDKRVVWSNSYRAPSAKKLNTGFTWFLLRPTSGTIMLARYLENW